MSRLVRSSDPDVPAMGEGGVFIISRRAPNIRSEISVDFTHPHAVSQQANR